jgi:hypothetical protein
MVPNMDSKWKRKKDTVNTFKVSTIGRLVTFTSKIFGIPLMKHSRYALKHCLVDVEEDKRACYATYQRYLGISMQMPQDKEWGTNNWPIAFSHFTNRKIP